MYNSREAIAYSDDATTNVLNSINNELVVSNMIAALNNPEIHRILGREQIETIAKAICSHVLTNAEGLQVHNAAIDEARENRNGRGLYH